MKKYRVKIKETFVCYVDVEANDKDAAYEIVENRVEDCNLIVSHDWDDMERDISVVQELSNLDDA